jgi:hypothetical protein
MSTTNENLRVPSRATHPLHGKRKKERTDARTYCKHDPNLSPKLGLHPRRNSFGVVSHSRRVAESHEHVSGGHDKRGDDGGYGPQLEVV